MEKGRTILFGLPGAAVERVECVTGADGELARLVRWPSSRSGRIPVGWSRLQ
jgi:hypothetical protein